MFGAEEYEVEKVHFIHHRFENDGARVNPDYVGEKSWHYSRKDSANT